MTRAPRVAGLLSLVVPVVPMVLAGCGDEAALGVSDAPLLAAEAELRIGSVDNPATMLTWIRGMAVDGEGRIYSAHPQENVVLVHGPDGRRLGRIGGPGDGPGEFRAVGAMGLRGDSLWVMDYRQYRITWFAPDGRVLRSVRVAPEMGREPGRSPPRLDGVLADGRLHGSPPAWSREVAAGTLTEQPVLVMDTTGATSDTLFTRPLTIWAITDPSGAGGFGSYRAQPFDDDALHVLDPYAPAYVVVERAVEPEGQATFRVARVRFDGDTVFSRVFPYDPVPLDPAVPDSLVDAWAATFENPRFPGAPTPAKAAEWARASLYVPAHWPPVTAVVPGSDGTLWLQREEQDPDTVEWLVLDAGGEPVGRVRLPGRVNVAVARRDRVWGWEQDALDVPYIVSYDVGAGAAGAAD